MFKTLSKKKFIILCALATLFVVIATGTALAIAPPATTWHWLFPANGNFWSFTS